MSDTATVDAIRSALDGLTAGCEKLDARIDAMTKNDADGVRIVYNKLLGGWYVVRGPRQSPLSGRFNSKEEAQAWLNARRGKDFVRQDEIPAGAQWRCTSCGHTTPANALNKNLKVGEKLKMRCWKENKNTTHTLVSPAKDSARHDYITESGGKYTVHAESGKPMGAYGSKGEAEKRLREIEYFKRKK